MGPILNDFTWTGWLAEIQHLLFLVALWLLGSWPGKTTLVMLVLVMASIICAPFGKAPALGDES